jgi:hypothetical protein
MQRHRSYALPGTGDGRSLQQATSSKLQQQKQTDRLMSSSRNQSGVRKQQGQLLQLLV